MSKIKQVIVFRKDLKCRKGKFAAQIAHASMKVWFDRMHMMQDIDGSYYETDIIPEDMIDWKENAFTKVVVYVNSEEEIYELAEKAKEVNIPYAVIIDNGMTEFAGKKTTTCIAIGPAKSEILDPITGDLKLL